MRRHVSALRLDGAPMTTRIAVIGAGLIGQKHAALVAAHPACTLAGLCDVDPGRAYVAAIHGAPFFTDTDALLRATAPDAAIIATPNAAHADAAELCAAHGIHMLIEKPIADTVESARHITAQADAAGVQVLVGHHRRHNPLVQAARAAVQGGVLGRLVGVTALWTLKKPDDYFDMAWRRERPGGGPALINLIHDVDNLRFICGEIGQVYAQTSSAVRGFAVEDTLSANLRFADGALGVMLAADATPAPWSYELTTGENPVYPQVGQDCYFFTGTDGALAFPSLTHWRYAANAPDGWHQPLEVARLHVQGADPLVAQLDHFVSVIRDAAQPLVDARDATRSLAVVLAMLASATRGQPVDIDDSAA